MGLLDSAKNLATQAERMGILIHNRDSIMSNPIVKGTNTKFGELPGLEEKFGKNIPFRKEWVDASLDNPGALKQFLRDTGETNEKQTKIANNLDDPETRQFLMDNRQTAYAMADPAQSSKQAQAILKKAMDNRPDPVNLSTKSIQPVEKQIDSTQVELSQAPMTQKPVELNNAQNKPSMIETVQEVQSPSPAQVPTTQISAVTSPLELGVNFMELLPYSVGKGTDSDVLNVVKKIQGNEELMTAVGKDFAEHGADIEKILPKLVAGNDPKVANEFMDKHPALAKATLPVMAVANPAGTSQMLANNAKEALLKGLKGDELKDMEALFKDVEQGGFFDKMTLRMGDPAQAGNILDNLETLKSGSGMGGSTATKIVLEDAKTNPDIVMDMLAGDMFAGQASQRWGGQIANAGIDNAFAGLEKGLAKLGKQFGFDASGMIEGLSGFKDTLKGFMGPMIQNLGGTMQDFQVAQKIQAGVDANLGVKGTSLAMNSNGGGMFGGLMQGFDKMKTRMAIARHNRMAAGVPVDSAKHGTWEERQIKFETEVREAQRLDPDNRDYKTSYVDPMSGKVIINGANAGPQVQPPQRSPEEQVAQDTMENLF